MKKILILCLLSISFSQEFDYSKMSEVEKIMFYNSMKKSPTSAGFIELFIPSAGYAYVGQWGTREMVIGIGKILYPFIGIYAINDDTGPNDDAGAFGALVLLAGSILSGYSVYDAMNKTSEYNNKLYKNIFGKEMPRISTSLYPLQDGAGISLTYLIN